jgi:hypothetical protein
MLTEGLDLWNSTSKLTCRYMPLYLKDACTLTVAVCLNSWYFKMMAYGANDFVNTNNDNNAASTTTQNTCTDG